MEKLDLKRQLKHLYTPSAKEVSIVDVPSMTFLRVEGRIESGLMPGTSPSFAHAIGAMYGFAYTLKFMSKQRVENPIDYPVMALEGLWTTPAGGEDYAESDGWLWTLLIMQPHHIDQGMFAQAHSQLKEKKEKAAAKAAKKADAAEVGAVDDFAAAVAWLEKVQLEDFHEGLCIQTMHVGPYSEEPATLAKMDIFAQQNGYVFHGKHHEIYLGDPRTAKPENLKTVLRHPVRRSE
jgi:hypothetical protein